MIFETIMRVIFSIFAVFGFYTAIKMIFFMICYNRHIRKSIKIVAEIRDDDDELTRELKEMCARDLRRDLGIR